MSILLTADLHLTDRPQDEYRWGLFPWLVKKAAKHKVDTIILAGDITDAKDRHSAKLVNRTVQAIVDLARSIKGTVFILRGNHDYIDEQEPFFGFVREFGETNRDYPEEEWRVDFITEPTKATFNGWPALLLPNTRDYKKAWADLDFTQYEYIFAHQTFDGAVTENGTQLPGIPPSLFRKPKGARAMRVYSGDIHVPQRVSRNIEYVGAPYRIRFGDKFAPRVLLLEPPGKQSDLHFPCTNKVLMELETPISAKDARHRFRQWAHEPIYEGDQIKVRVKLKRAAFAEWPAIRAALIEEAADSKLELLGLELVGIQAAPKSAPAGQNSLMGAVSPLAALEAYAEKKAVPAPLKSLGTELLKAAAQ